MDWKTRVSQGPGRSANASRSSGFVTIAKVGDKKKSAAVAPVAAKPSAWGVSSSTTSSSSLTSNNDAEVVSLKPESNTNAPAGYDNESNGSVSNNALPAGSVSSTAFNDGFDVSNIIANNMAEAMNENKGLGLGQRLGDVNNNDSSSNNNDELYDRDNVGYESSLNLTDNSGFGDFYASHRHDGDKPNSNQNRRGFNGYNNNSFNSYSNSSYNSGGGYNEFGSQKAHGETNESSAEDANYRYNNDYYDNRAYDSSNRFRRGGSSYNRDSRDSRDRVYPENDYIGSHQGNERHNRDDGRNNQNLNKPYYNNSFNKQQPQNRNARSASEDASDWGNIESELMKFNDQDKGSEHDEFRKPFSSHSYSSSYNHGSSSNQGGFGYNSYNNKGGSGYSSRNYGPSSLPDDEEKWTRGTKAFSTISATNTISSSNIISSGSRIDDIDDPWGTRDHESNLDLTKVDQHQSGYFETSNNLNLDFGGFNSQSFDIGNNDVLNTDQFSIFSRPSKIESSLIMASLDSTSDAAAAVTSSEPSTSPLDIRDDNSSTNVAGTGSSSSPINSSEADFTWAGTSLGLSLGPLRSDVRANDDDDEEEEYGGGDDDNDEDKVVEVASVVKIDHSEVSMNRGRASFPSKTSSSTAPSSSLGPVPAQKMIYDPNLNKLVPAELVMKQVKKTKPVPVVETATRKSSSKEHASSDRYIQDNKNTDAHVKIMKVASKDKQASVASAGESVKHSATITATSATNTDASNVDKKNKTSNDNSNSNTNSNSISNSSNHGVSITCRDCKLSVLKADIKNHNCTGKVDKEKQTAVVDSTNEKTKASEPPSTKPAERTIVCRHCDATVVKSMITTHLRTCRGCVKANTPVATSSAVDATVNGTAETSPSTTSAGISKKDFDSKSSKAKLKPGKPTNTVPLVETSKSTPTPSVSLAPSSNANLEAISGDTSNNKSTGKGIQSSNKTEKTLDSSKGPIKASRIKPVKGKGRGDGDEDSSPSAQADTHPVVVEHKASTVSDAAGLNSNSNSNSNSKGNTNTNSSSSSSSSQPKVYKPPYVPSNAGKDKTSKAAKNRVDA